MCTVGKECKMGSYLSIHKFYLQQSVETNVDFVTWGGSTLKVRQFQFREQLTGSAAFFCMSWGEKYMQARAGL
jgi:hypothetical protein